MKEKEYAALKEKIQAEAAEKLQALDLVWTLSGGEPAANKRTLPRGEISTLIRNVALSLPATFTVSSINGDISQLKPELPVSKASITKVLKKLQKEGAITLVKQGEGRKSSIFRRI